MAESLAESQEAQDVLELIQENKNFLLSGGAGSGKTYTLVEIIRLVQTGFPTEKVRCITYTNAAANEIGQRLAHPNLEVSTIHDFLWDNIKQFKTELKRAVIKLMNDDDVTKFPRPNEDKVPDTYFNDLSDGIQYKEFVKLQKGIISHDEVIILAHYLFAAHPKLCRLTNNCFPFIFVDEYQDTDPQVVRILLEHLQSHDSRCIVGFFGDSMQSIYDGSVGNLNTYKEVKPPKVKEVIKKQNRRNPVLVINLANQLRDDGLKQRPSDDLLAPNMNGDGTPKQGCIKFLHSDNDDLDAIRMHLGWDFSDTQQTKELNLTHNLIASKAGFPSLMRIYDGDKILDYVKRIKSLIKEKAPDTEVEGKSFGEVVDELKAGKDEKSLKPVLPTKGMQEYINQHKAEFEFVQEMDFQTISSLYVSKDQLLDDKKNDTQDEGRPSSQRDDLIKHLFKIQHNILLYQQNKISEFLRHTDFALTSVAAKRELKKSIEALTEVGEKTIGQIIQEANDYGVAQIDDRLNRFIKNKPYIYRQVTEVPFSQLKNLYLYLEGYTPFSTQHKTKGAEFKNVFVILDNGNWNQYNFEALFTGVGKDTVLERTRKIFYVCCTRAKENLAVFFHRPSTEVIVKAQEWFGEENVISLNSKKED